MLKFKCQLICSYYSRIVKDPIELPCEDSVCREHLSETDNVKQNKIKCKACNDAFQVKVVQFKTHKVL